MTRRGSIRHFLRDDDLTPAEQSHVLTRAAQLKVAPLSDRRLQGRAVALMFDKPSTRTRVSFSIGVSQMGGYPLLVDGQTSQLGRGESIADTTRFLDRQVDLITWRTFGQSRLEEMSRISRVPVINGLTDEFHPCQILADLLTIRERKGGTEGRTLSYLGDCANNMAHSYLLGGALAGMNVRLGGPAGHHPNPAVLADAHRLASERGASVLVTEDPAVALAGADVVTTDTWVSMGMETDKSQRMGAANPFLRYQVNDAAMRLASVDAIFLHCLPAYRGYEVTESVLEGEQSAVWDEAENRLHAQKALIGFLLDSCGQDGVQGR